jgi:hypothetical protein
VVGSGCDDGYGEATGCNDHDPIPSRVLEVAGDLTQMDHFDPFR